MSLTQARGAWLLSILPTAITSRISETIRTWAAAYRIWDLQAG